MSYACGYGGLALDLEGAARLAKQQQECARQDLINRPEGRR